jgi:aspartyl-tRNA(Asn)/glutamyl-tRNA(Gln) amidotransferase subunit A
MIDYASDRAAFDQGSTSCAERTSACLQRITERQALNAFLHVDTEGAVSAAATSDERYAAGLARPLEGLVMAVKDNINVNGMPLTCASRMLEGFRPLYDATVIERLRDAGAVIIGKTNLDEFAMGSSNETSAFGPVHHPLDETRVPGGSSGGSAVAVAAGMCHASLGSDTGGSIRQPAAFCGTYGLKPTYGRVSRYGLVAFASSLDQIGVFASSLRDTAAVFDVISGHDPMDATSLPGASSHALDALATPLHQPLRIGVLPRSAVQGCEPAILDAYDAAIERYKAQGAAVIEVALGHEEIWVPTYFILATAEASSNLARFDGVRYGHRAAHVDGVDMTTASRTEGFGAEVKRRIMLGTYVLSSGYYDAYYRKAQQARRVISDAYEAIFREVDALCMPTTPTTAFRLGENNADPVQMWLSDYFTVSANIAGIPALSVPFGNDAAGLPVGLQLQGPLFSDERLMQIAAVLQ